MEAEYMPYSSETNGWSQNVYYAWVLYGAASYMCAIYWIQRYYFENWYALPAEYLSEKPTTFTMFGIGEEINRVWLMSVWGLTAFLWTVSLMRMDGIFFFFVIWARILHYLDVARLITVQTFKFIGMAMDTKEDYQIESGLDLDEGAENPVSIMQSLSGTDWYMESFGLTVSFSLYGDLIGIAKSTDKDAAIESAEDAIDMEFNEEDDQDDMNTIEDEVNEFADYNNF